MPKAANAKITEAQKRELARLEYERFLETAKALGADKASPDMDRALRKAVTPQRAKRKG